MKKGVEQDDYGGYQWFIYQEIECRGRIMVDTVELSAMKSSGAGGLWWILRCYLPRKRVWHKDYGGYQWFIYQESEWSRRIMVDTEVLSTKKSSVAQGLWRILRCYLPRKRVWHKDYGGYQWFIYQESTQISRIRIDSCVISTKKECTTP